MVPKTSRCRGGKLKVSYTNVNGLVSSLLELNDYLENNTPDVMGITETKLNEQIVSINIGNGKYNVWRKDQKQKKGGVMVLMKKELQVREGKSDTERELLKL